MTSPDEPKEQPLVPNQSTYTVVMIKDGSYGVRVSPPTYDPSSTVNGYRTASEAEADIPRLRALHAAAGR